MKVIKRIPYTEKNLEKVSKSGVNYYVTLSGKTIVIYEKD